MSKKPKGAKKVPTACYTPEQLAFIAQVEADLAVQLSSKPRRLAHSLSVATTAESLALMYGCDPFLARVAGLLHDWCKVVPDDELVARAREHGLDFGCGDDYSQVKPLLHGAIAALELPERYPELPEEVWHAVSVHTTAAADMSDLDKVIFVADGIEPLRPASEGIEASRALVGRSTLDDLFWNCFVGGLVYVLECGKNLYLGSVVIYNALAARRYGRAG